MIRFLRIAAAALFLAPGVPATAASVEWTLNNFAFEDGTTASGSFVWDTVASAVSGISITTTAGSDPDFPAADFSIASPVQGRNDTLRFFDPRFPNPIPGASGDLELRIGLSDLSVLSTPVASLALTGNTVVGTTGYALCFNCNPFTQGVEGAFLSAQTAPVPLPAASLFLLGAVGTLVVARRRRST